MARTGPKSGFWTRASWVQFSTYQFIGFGVVEVTKPYEFIGFGVVEVTKPYECIGFGVVEVTKPYEFVGFSSRAISILFFGHADQAWGPTRQHRRFLLPFEPQTYHFLLKHC